MPVNAFSTMASNNIIWVESEMHAYNSPVAFGHSVLFMDKNEEKFYIKSVDQSGVTTSFKKFNRVEIIDPPPEDFVPKKDFDTIRSEFDELKKMVVEMNKQQNYKNNRRPNNGQ